ncbi:MAG: phosphate-starvation-inducible PsiE family protein [Chryseolinea sp.]
MDKGFEHIIERVEKYISYTLITVGLIFAIYQSIELVYLVFKNLYSSFMKGEFFVSQHGMPIAGLFFNILLLLEVLETVKTFSKGHIIKIKIILIVGIIAVTRKLLMGDMTHAEPMEEIAVGVVILALAVGYFLVSKAANDGGKEGAQKDE